MFSQNVPPDLSICGFVLAQCLSVRALQEMLARRQQMTEKVSSKCVIFSTLDLPKIPPNPSINQFCYWCPTKKTTCCGFRWELLEAIVHFFMDRQYCSYTPTVAWYVSMAG